MRLIKYDDVERVVKDYWKAQVEQVVKPDKHMDFESLSGKCDEILNHNSDMLKAISDIEPIDAIPVEWLRAKMEKSSGFRHAVLSEIIEEWEGMKNGTVS